jgi:adenylate kinase family enzyme
MSNENVVMETKIQPPKEENNIKISINEQQAAANIAKSLFQDFLTLITVVGLRAIFSKFPNSQEVFAELKEVWKKRNSVQLAEETKVFQQSVLNAFKSESEIDVETSEKINKQINSFNNTRDNAVKIATEAVDQIIESIIQKPEETEKTKEENTNE